MIIETICEKGIVRLPADLRYRRDAFKITVEIPDRELMTEQAERQPQPAQPTPREKTDIRGRIDAILAPFKHQFQDRPPFSARDYKDMRHQHLEEKHLDRD